MQYNEICQTLIHFINSTILQDNNSGLAEDTPLLEMGVINSLQTLRLTVFIKKQFACTIPDEKINLETFGNIKSIAKLIASLKSEVMN